MIKIGSFLTRVLTAGAYPPRPWRFRIAAWLVLLAMLWPVTQYLRLVLRSPQRTGMLVIGTNYPAPWDINPWCEENIAALEKLDKHNLSLRRLSDPSQLVFGQWAELEDDVEHLVEGTPKQQPLLVYINLHGIVSVDGRPYLLIRESKPLDPSTWLPFDVLVERIRQSLPHPREVVIAIEGGRQHALPLPSDHEHSFADAVRTWYAALQSSGQSKGLSVLLSSSSRNGSVEHAGTAGDLFTSCLAEALCGRCDQSEQAGNGNKQVEWLELQRYVHEQVERRSRQLRVIPQVTEHLVSEDAPRFLAWHTTVNTDTLFAVNSDEPDPTQIESLTAAWKRIYALQSSQPWHEDPATWGTLKRTMVAWEQSLFGGNGSRSRSSELGIAAEQYLELFESFTNKREQASGLESSLAQRAARLWDQLCKSPSISVAKQIVDSDTKLQSPDQWCALPMLAELVDQPDRQIWRQPELLARWSALQARIERVRSEQTHTPRLRELVNLEEQVDQLRRQLEDAICADAIDEQWFKTIASVESQVDRWQTKTEHVLVAVRFNEQMLARLPTICEAVDFLDAIGHESGKLSVHLDVLEQAVTANRQRLAVALQEETIAGELISPNAAAEELFHHIAQRWQRMLFDSSVELSAHVMPLESLLNSSLLPVEIGSIDKAVQLRLTTHKRLAQVHTDQHNPVNEELEFGVHNQNRLKRWLDWTSGERPGEPAIINRADQTWLSMHTARARACFGLDESVTQPVRDWQCLQVSARLLEASHRVLNDFWKGPQVNGQDYYVALTHAFVRGVHQMDQVEIESLLLLRNSAARDGLKLDCECRPIWNEHSSRTTSCCITQSTTGLPAGLAALEIVQPQASERLSPRVAVSISAAVNTQTLPMSTSSPKSTSSRSSVVARVTYRGHEFESPFDLHPSVGNATTGVTASTGSASITVQSNARRQRARILVLDCSASMHQPQSAEGTFDATAPQQTPSRLDAARLALQRILDHWRSGSDHIGVVLYGHRVAMGTKEQGKLKQTRYLSRYPFSQEIEAYEDVETILPPGRFGDQEYSAVVERLQSIVPWGQTPLYLSVAHAVHELDRYAHGTEPSSQAKMDLDVIVVSDGRNYQFNPTPEKNIALEQVIEQANRCGVRVHVIGFSIAANELEQATSEFTQLAEKTGGSLCMEVQTAIQLAQRIDSLTEPETFRVRLPDGKWIDSRCGQRVNLTMIDKPNTPIMVDYQRSSALIPANPNSAIQLTPGSNRRLVRAQLAFESSARAAVSTPSGQSSPFDVVLNGPKANSNMPGWQLSLERRDELVAQRPKVLWIELQPEYGSESDSTTYVVCDPLWQSDTTDPVLDFQTHDWPDAASVGTLKFWCSDQLPEPIIKFSCDPSRLTSDWLAQDQPDERQVQYQVQYQVQAEQDGVTLVLLHKQASEVLELMPLIANLPSETLVDRRYQPAQRISIHRFSHPQLKSLPSLDVAIYSVSEFKSQALRSATAIELRMSKNAAALPVKLIGQRHSDHHNSMRPNDSGAASR